MALKAAHMLGMGRPGAFHMGRNWLSLVKRTTCPVRQL
jgi:hypothetical protein